MMHGADDYGLGTSAADYRTMLEQLVADIRADVQTGIAAQGRNFAFFTYQESGAVTSDTNGLAVGVAQLESADENAGWYVVGPVYPVTDKGGHLTSNGFRWLGQMFGKVMARVLIRGEQWRPLSPLKVVRRGREILASFHVPCPPLVFGTPYAGVTATDSAAKGFAVLDEAGSAGVSDVQIVGDAVVKITASRDLAGPVVLRYAGKATFNGNGCLRDSDPTIARDTYEYSAGSGDYAEHEIAELVDEPYPLWNWCVAFNETAEEG
jgi:hypothetical protein